MKYLLALIFAFAVLGALLDEPVDMPVVDLGSIEAKVGISQSGKVLIHSDQQELSEWEVQQRIDQNSATRRLATGYLVWGDENLEPAIVSAPGLDWRHHFSQSYLVGILPFETENKWLPMYALDNRKSYQLDREQYGLDEVWQTSAEAFLQLRGDCEDHAIVLADWLISLGVDARVVLGTMEGTGHAWVVAFHNQRTFLLEATDKNKYRSWKHYPLADLAHGYEPSFMFNRTTFWVNTGNTTTRSYTGNQWVASATFRRAAGTSVEVGR